MPPRPCWSGQSHTSPNAPKTMQYHRLESDETLYFLPLHFLTRAGSSAISLPLLATVALCFRRVVVRLAMHITNWMYI